MLGMAERNKSNNRKGSRHKDRHTVSLPGDIYALMQQLADSEERHLRQQVILACKAHLREKGLWPPDAPSED
jgi:hypothetical protein